MKWWINLFLIIIIMVLIVPTVIVNGFSNVKPDKALSLNEKDKDDSISIIEEYKEPIITLYNHYAKKVVKIPLEEYVVGVVAAEMPASFELEALKAQAVAARTLAVRKAKAFGGSGCRRHEGADVCSDFSCCQAWIPDEQQRKNWGEKYQENREKIQKAVYETKGYIMTYNGKPIEVLFFSTSNGKTEDAQEVFSNSRPYYTVVNSPGEEDAPRYSSTVSLTRQQFTKVFKNRYPNSNLSYRNLENQISIISYTDSGRVRELQVGNTKVKGTDFRQLYKLNSTDFKFRFDKEKVYIDTIGYGHGVGMSQVGADRMAQKGSSYVDILNHYYRGIKVEKIR